MNKLSAFFTFQMKMVSACITVSACVFKTGCGLFTQKVFLNDAFRDKLFKPAVNRSDSYGDVSTFKIQTNIIYRKMSSLCRFQVGDKQILLFGFV